MYSESNRSVAPQLHHLNNVPPPCFTSPNNVGALENILPLPDLSLFPSDLGPRQIVNVTNSPDMRYLLKMGVGDKKILRNASVFEKAVRFRFESEIDYLTCLGHEESIPSYIDKGEVIVQFKAAVESNPGYKKLLERFPKIDHQRCCKVFRSTKLTVKKRQLRLIFATAHQLVMQMPPKAPLAAPFVGASEDRGCVNFFASPDRDGIVHVNWWNPAGECLGQGAFCRVLPGYDLTAGRHVAVKIAKPGLTPERTQRTHELFLHEARLLEKLHGTQKTPLRGLHARVISIICSTDDFDGQGLVLPFYCGNFTQLSPSLDKQWICNGLLDLLRALQVFRKRGYFHGDVKGDNILLRPGVGEIIEFALSDVAGSRQVRDKRILKQLRTSGVAGHLTAGMIRQDDLTAIKNAVCNLPDPIELTDPRLEEIIHLLHLKDIDALAMTFWRYFGVRYSNTSDLKQNLAEEFGTEFVEVLECMGHPDIYQRIDAQQALERLVHPLN